MNKAYFDLCYEILSHYLNFPDVADTYKSIGDGFYHIRNFPMNDWDFGAKKAEIISYIMKVRLNNIIDAYQDSSNMLLLVPVPSGRTLFDLNRQELYDNLYEEIPRLILKGIHQTIKHLNEKLDNNELTAELLRQDTKVLQKYKLQGAEEACYYGQA